MKKEQKYIEIEGTDVEDAIKKAMQILRVSKDELIVKVVSEEQKGLFGMEGARPAKIRVAKKSTKSP